MKSLVAHRLGHCCCERNHSTLSSFKQLFYFVHNLGSQEFGKGGHVCSPAMAAACRLGLQPSERSPGLDIEDGTFAWLAVSAGCQLGALLSFWSQVAGSPQKTRWKLHGTC